MTHRVLDDLDENVHEGPKNYKCNKCWKSFTSQKQKKRHIKTVHDKIKCDHCTRIFSDNYRLKIHVKGRIEFTLCSHFTRTHGFGVQILVQIPVF